MLATDYNNSKLEHLPKITIEVIDHNDHKYETCGNYFENPDGSWTIQVSKTNLKYEFYVAIHELIEKVLCHCKGITDEEITKFDEEFENMRDMYPKIVGDYEPGNNDNAPYNHEHIMASRVEKWLVESSDDKGWNEYDKTINALKRF